MFPHFAGGKRLRFADQLLVYGDEGWWVILVYPLWWRSTASQTGGCMRVEIGFCANWTSCPSSEMYSSIGRRGAPAFSKMPVFQCILSVVDGNLLVWSGLKKTWRRWKAKWLVIMDFILVENGEYIYICCRSETMMITLWRGPPSSEWEMVWVNKGILLCFNVCLQ